jgi:hypothetical protein
MVSDEYIVAKTITGSMPQDGLLLAIKTYWCEENMVFLQEGPVFHAHRGNLLANGFAIHPAKVKSALTITSLGGSLDCLLRVDTRFQDMTDWTKAFFHLEMNTFESYLLYQDRQEQLWSSFFREFDAAFVRWTLSLCLFGRNMSRDQWNTYTGLRYIR